MTTRSEEIQKRRIFGIISHPDAGKTTLTEKLLLHGGAIREAGTVKARRNSKFATSDWMEIEKQRGISVTSSVMQFAYAGKVISIMDTPGHNDFGEDTYRILTSVDSAVMVIDGAKGIEAQTKKLFKVCSMRGIPIFTFINKLDRETKEPFDLVQELEDVLGLPSVPVSWPIGNGMNFEGIYDLLKNEVHLYKSGKQTKTLTLGPDGVFGPELENEIAGYNLSALRDEIELIQGAGNEFDMELVSKGKLSPVFFGSALADFGTIPFLEHFLDMSPAQAHDRRSTADRRIFQRLYLQDPGEHEPGAPRQTGVSSHLLRHLYPRHERATVPDRQGNETGAVHHADGQRTRKHRNCDRGRYHRDL